LVSPSQGGLHFANKAESGCIEASIAKATVAAATKRGAAAIIVLAGKDSKLPNFVSAYRPQVPIVTFVPSSKRARQLILNRGIHPVVGALSGVTFHKRPALAIKHAKEMGFVKVGDDVVVVGMEDEEGEEFGTMKVTAVH
jgi:pyruvate kinase